MRYKTRAFGIACYPVDSLHQSSDPFRGIGGVQPCAGLCPLVKRCLSLFKGVSAQGFHLSDASPAIIMYADHDPEGLFDTLKPGYIDFNCKPSIDLEDKYTVREPYFEPTGSAPEQEVHLDALELRIAVDKYCTEYVLKQMDDFGVPYQYIRSIRCSDRVPVLGVISHLEMNRQDFVMGYFECTCGHCSACKRASRVNSGISRFRRETLPRIIGDFAKPYHDASVGRNSLKEVLVAVDVDRYKTHEAYKAFGEKIEGDHKLQCAINLAWLGVIEDYDPNSPCDFSDFIFNLGCESHIYTQAGDDEDTETEPQPRVRDEVLGSTPHINVESDSDIPSPPQWRRPGPNDARSFFGSAAFLQHINNEEHTSILKKVETYGLLIASLATSSSALNFGLIVQTFINTHLGFSYVDVGKEWFVLVLQDLIAALSDADGVRQQAGYEPPLDGDSFFHNVANCWKRISDSVLIRKLKKLAVLFSSLLACSFLGVELDKCKFGKIWQSCKQSATGVDLFGQMLSSLMWILDRCLGVIRGDTKFMDIFTNEDAGQKFDIQYARFMGCVDKIEAGGEAEFTLEQTLTLVLSMERECVLQAKKAKGKMEQIAFGRQIERLNALSTRLNATAHNANLRRSPFAFCLSGESGVGKSVISSLCVHSCQRAMGLPVGTNTIFNLNTNDKYMSDYGPYVNAIMLDDIANTKPDFTETAPSDMIVAIINNFPRFATMADVSDKGKFAIRPDIVCGTTNLRQLNASVYTVEPLSMLRRFKYHIEMEVKEEFRQEGTLMLRPDVLPHEHHHDLWLFTVSEAIHADPAAAQGKKGIRFRTIVDGGQPLHDINFSQLLKFLVKTSKIHLQQQKDLVARANSLHLSEFCVHEIPLAVCLECIPVVEVDLQAGVFSDGVRTMQRLKAYAGVGKLFFNEKERKTLYCTLVFECLTWLAIYCALPAWREYLAAICFASVAAVLTMCGAKLFNFHAEVARVTRPGESLTCFFEATDLLERVARNGKRVVRDHYKIAGVVTFVGLIYGAYMLYKRDSPTSQGAAFSVPIPDSVKPLHDPWRRPELSVPAVNQDMRNTTGKQLSEVLVKKLCLLRVHSADESKGRQCLCFPVATGFWIVPHHIMDSDYEWATVVQFDEDKLNCKHKFIRRGSYHRIGETDMSLVYMPGKADQKDLINCFPDKVVDVRAKAARVAWAKREMTEGGYARLVKGVACVNATTSFVVPNDSKFGYHGGCYAFTMPTWDGLCGAPLVMEGGGTFILGIHSAGRTGSEEARYCSVTRTDLLAARAKFLKADTACMQGAESAPFDVALNFPDDGFKFIWDAKPKSKANWIDGEYMLLGSHSGQRRTFRSKVVKTPISDDVDDIMHVPRKHGAPAHINTWLPWHMWLKSCSAPCPVPMEELDKAYLCYKSKIFAELEKHPEWKEKIHPVTDDVVLSGADGVKGCYAVNEAASAGIPWCCPKNQFISKSDRFVPGISCPRDAPDWFMKEVERQEEVLASGKRIYAPHRGNVKDEPIKLDKAKVRVFSGTNMVYLFLMRRYFLMLSVFFQNHTALTECAVGINCFSREWDDLYEHVTQHGVERIIAGDYQGYDQVISSQLTLAAFKLLIAIAEWAGFSERQLAIMRGLATETCFPVYEVGGEWIQMNGTNPSGHSLTVVINNIVNCFYVRIAFYVAMAAASVAGMRFHEEVALVCYGDDNKMSVSERAPWFTHTAIQEVLARYGIVYTMADKSAGSVPYVHDRDASFLKRYFLPDMLLDRVCPPLELDSIYKSLHSVVASSFMSLEEQTAECVKNANREFFFHGKQFFELRRSQLLTIMEKNDLLHYLPHKSLADYEEVGEWYRSQF